MKLDKCFCNGLKNEYVEPGSATAQMVEELHTQDTHYLFTLIEIYYA